MSTAEDGGTDIDLDFIISTAASVSIDKTLGDSKDLSVWPNPAADQLNWNIENTRVERVELISLMGQRVYESDRPEKELPLTGLPDGVYFIRISRDSKLWVKKFVVSR